jgi:hypothetical protein
MDYSCADPWHFEHFTAALRTVSVGVTEGPPDIHQCTPELQALLNQAVQARGELCGQPCIVIKQLAARCACGDPRHSRPLEQQAEALPSWRGGGAACTAARAPERPGSLGAAWTQQTLRCAAAGSAADVGDSGTMPACAATHCAAAAGHRLALRHVMSGGCTGRSAGPVHSLKRRPPLAGTMRDESGLETKRHTGLSGIVDMPGCAVAQTGVTPLRVSRARTTAAAGESGTGASRRPSRVPAGLEVTKAPRSAGSTHESAAQAPGALVRMAQTSAVSQAASGVVTSATGDAGLSGTRRQKADI